MEWIEVEAYKITEVLNTIYDKKIKIGIGEMAGKQVLCIFGSDTITGTANIVPETKK